MRAPVTYALMDPSGNRTILVTSPVAPEDRAAVAARLMTLEPTAEQTGFLSLEDGVCLQMAGGEFCGNATMSAAVYAAMRRGESGGKFLVHTSGAAGPVPAEVLRRGDVWQGTVEMPKPVSVAEVTFPDGQRLPVAAFPGISHVILDGPVDRKEAEAAVRTWCSFLNADALGLLFLDRTAGTLTPLVFVPAAGTLFWESACGSGAAAVGAWLAKQRGKTVTHALRQPGGVLTVTADPGGKILLQGTVKCLGEKTALPE